MLRLEAALLAAAFSLAAGLAGCGAPKAASHEGPIQFVEIREVFVTKRSGGEESKGYLKRYKRRTSAGVVYWVEVYTPQDVQVGFVEESGRTYKWVGRDGESGRWTDLGRFLLEEGVCRLLDLDVPCELRTVQTRAAATEERHAVK